MTFIAFIAGVIIGGAVGVIIMALMSIAKEADRHIGADEEKKE